MVHVPGEVFLAGGTRRSEPAQRLFRAADIPFVLAELDDGSPLRQLRELISGCSAVFAYITSARPPIGTVLEVGAGIGLGLPTFLIFGPRVRIDALPAALRVLPSMRLPEEGSADGAERLRSLIAIGSQAVARSTSPSRAFPSGDVGRLNWADDSERRAAEVLQSLGVHVIGFEPSNRKGRPDLAAWLPDLAEVPYNPVLVEVAGRHANPKDKERQLREHMHLAGALLGIVVFQGHTEPNWRVQSSGAVLHIGVEDLAALKPASLVSLLREGRNQLFHAA